MNLSGHKSSIAVADWKNMITHMYCFTFKNYDTEYWFFIVL